MVRQSRYYRILITNTFNYNILYLCWFGYEIIGGRLQLCTMHKLHGATQWYLWLIESVQRHLKTCAAACHVWECLTTSYCTTSRGDDGNHTDTDDSSSIYTFFTPVSVLVLYLILSVKISGERRYCNCVISQHPATLFSWAMG